MVHRIVFWSGFGVAVRAWQLGIQHQPILQKNMLWAYPVFAGVGASFGYWLQGVDERQTAVLNERKESILEKRARRAQREAGEATA